MCAVTQAMSSAEQSHIADRDKSSAVQRAEMQLETERDRGVDSVLQWIGGVDSVLKWIGDEPRCDLV